MTWAESLVQNYTDGIVVLHRGRIVYERYFGALTSRASPHRLFVTKSFFGTLAGALIAEGKARRRTRTVESTSPSSPQRLRRRDRRAILDMTTAIDFVETYPAVSEHGRYRYATRFAIRPTGYEGPKSIHAMLPTIKKEGTHGEEFHYRTPNVEDHRWLIKRVTGKSPSAVLSERIWSRMGAEGDGFLADEQRKMYSH